MSPLAKLGLGAAIVAAGTTYLAYLGASTSWQYYLLVDECIQNQDELLGHRMRVTGKIAAHSLQFPDEGRKATFVLYGQRSELQVSCRGPLPDNLQEGIDVVVEGTLERGGLLRGEKVMTRCASKYQASPESDSRD
jgi:cytochrome c-type biogenesis protein CcmE